MIAHLRGILIESTYTEAIVECAGVGYAVNIPLCTFEKLPVPGKEVSLHTILIVREDDMSLYGFSTKRELQVFRLLNTVNGIGAKTALNILSSMNIQVFCQAILSGDIKTLKKINGVGPKSAERMVVELRDKVREISPESEFTAAAKQNSREIEDAALALEQLGFNRVKIIDSVAKVAEELPENERSVENIIRKSLQTLNKG